MQKTTFFKVKINAQVGGSMEIVLTAEPSREDILACLEIDRAIAQERADAPLGEDKIDDELAQDRANEELADLRLFTDIVSRAPDLNPSISYERLITDIAVAGIKIGSIMVTPFEVFTQSPVNADRAIQELTA